MAANPVEKDRLSKSTTDASSKLRVPFDVRGVYPVRGKNPVDQGKSKTWLRVSLANLSPYVPSDNLLVHQLSQGKLLGFNMLRELLSRLRGYDQTWTLCGSSGHLT